MIYGDYLNKHKHGNVVCYGGFPISTLMVRSPPQKKYGHHLLTFMSFQSHVIYYSLWNTK